MDARAKASAGEGAQAEDQSKTVSHAKDACLRLLARRPRSRAELEQRLARRGFDADVVNAALDRLAECGLIDDAEFAEMLTRSRHTFSGRGRRAIAVELRQKGISDHDAARALAQISTDDERARATELVRRKLRSNFDRRTDTDRLAQRLVGMLARRGFGQGLAVGIVKAELAAAGAELEEMPTEISDE
ncbi:regulatory protein RecX [Skermania sp. ID1734]|uniref:regulatory protein RecX n=1 Tax=Skermania sp. ID1734 TaxID=2597516 RepID=UPI001180C6AB|nr:regulatory protein RecX [Skermania sp. ID1734]TSD96129.1 regulatory protein RecX [Skermania sp. ID1734]